MIGVSPKARLNTYSIGTAGDSLLMSLVNVDCRGVLGAVLVGYTVGPTTGTCSISSSTLLLSSILPTPTEPGYHAMLGARVC